MVSTYLETNEREVRNNAGGLSYGITPLERLERFLIIGSVDGTYYVNARDLTKQNLDNIKYAIDVEGTKAVDVIRDIGTSSRAPKHDPVLLAYAIAVSANDQKVRSYALSFFNDIVRTGTHLFHFLAYIEGRRGWGRSLRRAVANWYTEKSDRALALQLVKYKQRDGWSHRDALRLAHPIAPNSTKNGLLDFAVRGTLPSDGSFAHEFVEASLEALTTNSIERAIELVTKFNLPRETVNTKLLKDRRMWEAMAPHMGMTALLRNLRNMVDDGYLVQGSDAVRLVRERIINEDDLKRSRIHPAHIFLAKHNAKDVPQPIRNALEESFFMSFKNVEPTGKRIVLALDVSASMGQSSLIGRSYGPTAREWVALQAMVTARVEPYAEFRAFTNNYVPINISSKDSMEDVVKKTSELPFGGTDCSIPMFDARQKGEKFDAFCVYTDNETWASGYGSRGRSSGSPMHELRKYREKSGIHDAKLVVTGITATEFSIADPEDPNTLDVVGFDASAPSVLADFIRS